MSISAKGRVCGLFAYPIGHSLSPDMHNYFSEKLGMDEVYVPLQTAPEELAQAVKGAYAMNFLGMNVTIPHKQAVMEHLVELDESAKLVGAVNTLVRVEGGYKGYNTDMYGLTRSIKEQGVELSGCEAILIGAGGAAAAAVAMLVKEGASRLYILNRTLEKAEVLAERANGLAGRTFAKALSYEQLSEIPGYGTSEVQHRYLVIQSTNQGMSPKTDGVAVTDIAFYDLIHTAVEIIFNPAKTRFMELAEAAGATTIGGLKMLLYQGVRAYELWNALTIPSEIIDGAYALMEEKLR
jgi:shikimate dehydrogenase